MDAKLDTLSGPGGRISARRPLLGLTILLVEDSRFSSEAVRLICLKSGARLRRADCLRAASRHLATYRPSLAIIDLGLPDGSGLEIIRDLAALGAGRPKILATSSLDQGQALAGAMEAGADGFLPKPLKTLKSFQDAVLDLFPERRVARSSKILDMPQAISPDPLALSEDLHYVHDLLLDVAGERDAGVLDYAAQFLQSLAEAREDHGLGVIAAQLAQPLTVEKRLVGVVAGIEMRLAGLQGQTAV